MTSRFNNTVASDPRFTVRRPVLMARFLINRLRLRGGTLEKEIVLSRWIMDSPLWGSIYLKVWHKLLEEIQLARTADLEPVVKSYRRSKHLGWQSSISGVCNVFWKNTTVVRMSRVYLRQRRHRLRRPLPPHPRVVPTMESTSNPVTILRSWDFVVMSTMNSGIIVARTCIDINIYGKILAQHSYQHLVPKLRVRQRQVLFPKRHQLAVKGTEHRVLFMRHIPMVMIITNLWVPKTKSYWMSSPGGNKVNEKTSVYVGSNLDPFFTTKVSVVICLFSFFLLFSTLFSCINIWNFEIHSVRHVVLINVGKYT